MILYLILAVVGLVLLFLIVLNGSGRQRYTLNFTLHIRAPKNLIWNKFIGEYGQGSWRPEVVDMRHVDDDPTLIEQVCLHRGRRISIIIRILECVSGVSIVTSCERIADIEAPLGPTGFCAVKLDEHKNGTKFVYREEGDFDRPWDFIMFWLSQRAALLRLKAGAERATLAQAGIAEAVPTRFLVAGSTLVLALIISAVGWTLGILVFALMSVMEYGHARAIRRGGDQPSVAMLLPFVGGAMAMSRRQKTVLGDAASALSGPVALACLIMALTCAGVIAGEGPVADQIGNLAGISAMILALFLLPLYPLNGGWVIGVLHPHLPRRAVVLPAITAAVVVSVWGLMTQLPILTVFGALLAIQLMSPPRAFAKAGGTISARQALLIASAYAVMILLANLTINDWLVT